MFSLLEQYVRAVLIMEARSKPRLSHHELTETPDIFI